MKKKKMSKKVLIIIVNYNSSDYIGDCLSSLNKINYQKDDFKILVIDNNSTDGSVEYIERTWPEIELIKNNSNLGFAAANNIGLQQAVDCNFDYAYLLNQDTVVQSDFLQQAIKVAETSEIIGAVQSKLLLYSDKSKINSIGNEIHYLGFAFAGGYKLPDKPLAVKEITYPSGAGVLLNVKCLKKIGFFNPEFFMYHEDVDLGWRLWLAGYSILLAPESLVYHKYEFSRSIKKYYYMERNRYLVIFQNYKLSTLLLIAPALIFMDIVMFFYSFFSGWWLEELRVHYYFLIPANWIKIFKARKKIQKNRRIGDKEIMKRFVGKILFQDLANPLLKYVGNPILNLYWRIIKVIIF